MTPDERAAADGLYHALANLPCSCSHNVPYAGGTVKQVVTVQCRRCKAMRQWEALVLEDAA